MQIKMINKPFTRRVNLHRLTIWKETALPYSNDIRLENCCLSLLLPFIAVKLSEHLTM